MKHAEWWGEHANGDDDDGESNGESQPIGLIGDGDTCRSMRKDEEVAGVLGFEPRQTDPESVVLPLHYTPIGFHLSVDVDILQGGRETRKPRATRESGPGFVRFVRSV